MLYRFRCNLIHRCKSMNYDDVTTSCRNITEMMGIGLGILGVTIPSWWPNFSGWVTWCNLSRLGMEGAVQSYGPAPYISKEWIAKDRVSQPHHTVLLVMKYISRYLINMRGVGSKLLRTTTQEEHPQFLGDVLRILSEMNNTNQVTRLWNLMDSYGHWKSITSNHVHYGHL